MHHKCIDAHRCMRNCVSMQDSYSGVVEIFIPTHSIRSSMCKFVFLAHLES